VSAGAYAGLIRGGPRPTRLLWDEKEMREEEPALPAVPPHA